MKIQILGSGCASCKKFYELTQQAVDELGLTAEVEYVDDLQRIISMGVMQLPTLVIDNKIILSGLVPGKEKIREIINKHRA